MAGTPSAIAPLGTSMPLGTTAPAPTSAPGAHDRPVQHDRAGADERAVLDGAALEVREVADRAVGADDRLELAGAVQHRAVLHRRARARPRCGSGRRAARPAATRSTPGPSTTLPMIVASGCTKASGSICGTMSPRAYSAMARKVACRRGRRRSRATRAGRRRPRLHDRRGRDRARARRRAAPRPRAARAVLRGRARRQLVRGPPHAAPLQPARVRPASSSRSRCTAHVLPIVEGVLDPGCLISSLSSISIQPGETAQPIHADDQLIPIPKPHPPTVCNSMWALTDFTEANGATRLVPGTHLADHSPDYGADYDSIAAEMPAGSVLDLARQPLARRRREHDRRDAHGHRDELLRGLHPPAGEPAARPAARDGRRLLAAAARARRLQRLQHAHRPHQQAVARAAAARPRAAHDERRSSPMVWDRI